MVGATVTNVIVHAYAGARETGTVRVRCWVADGLLVVEVADDGAGLARRDDSPGVGHGLAMVGAVAEALDVARGPGGQGTVVTMTFATPATPERARLGLVALCRLALDAVADVSCVDLVRGGVLRRVAGEVAGDAGLTAWLRNATPPAKPGTATWAALREGGPQLVVHDPAVPRSPGGAGEILGLEWWVAGLNGASGIDGERHPHADARVELGELEVVADAGDQAEAEPGTGAVEARMHADARVADGHHEHRFVHLRGDLDVAEQLAADVGVDDDVRDRLRNRQRDRRALLGGRAAPGGELLDRAAQLGHAAGSRRQALVQGGREGHAVIVTITDRQVVHCGRMIGAPTLRHPCACFSSAAAVAGSR